MWRVESLPIIQFKKGERVSDFRFSSATLSDMHTMAGENGEICQLPVWSLKIAVFFQGTCRGQCWSLRCTMAWGLLNSWNRWFHPNCNTKKSHPAWALQTNFYCHSCRVWTWARSHFHHVFIWSSSCFLEGKLTDMFKFEKQKCHFATKKEVASWK